MSGAKLLDGTQTAKQKMPQRNVMLMAMLILPMASE